MALLNFSEVSPGQLVDFWRFFENAIKAIGGILIIYIGFLIWKIIMERKNHRLLIRIQNDLIKIKKKLKIN